MIVRILGEGQYEIADAHLDSLNRLDADLERAVEKEDEKAFAGALEKLLAAVRDSGERLSDDYLGSSDFALPGEDATIEEVRSLLTEEGLVPGR